MALFKNVPTPKKAQAVGDTVLKLSSELRNIIVSYNCVDFKKVNLGSLEYALFMYDLWCYSYVMTLKHNSFFIETTIRTVFSTMESNMKKAGNNIASGYMYNTFTKLSGSLNKTYDLAKKQGLDGFQGVAMYLCSDECGLSNEEIAENEEMICEIAKHFAKVLNTR